MRCFFLFLVRVALISRKLWQMRSWTGQKTDFFFIVQQSLASSTQLSHCFISIAMSYCLLCDCTHTHTHWERNTTHCSMTTSIGLHQNKRSRGVAGSQAHSTSNLNLQQSTKLHTSKQLPNHFRYLKTNNKKGQKCQLHSIKSGA